MEEEKDQTKKQALQNKLEHLQASFVPHGEADSKLVKCMDTACRLFLGQSLAPLGRDSTIREASERMGKALLKLLG